MWNISLKSLQNWRVKGGGPRFHKFGTAVRYSLADLERFEAQCVQDNTSQAA